MARYEYKVVAAPKRGQKARGVKGAEARFAHALEQTMNELAADGWEYLRTDTLPAEERQGLTGKTITFQNMMVFRRAAAGDAEAFAPKLLSHSDLDHQAPTDATYEEGVPDVSPDGAPSEEAPATDEAAQEEVAETR